MKNKKALIALLCVILICAVALAIVSCDILTPAPDVNNNYEITVTSEAMAYRYAALKVINSVVCVRAVFGSITSNGSGTIISSDGYVLTNRHVACYDNSNPRKPNDLEVDLIDEDNNVITFKAELVTGATSYKLDLAVIKIIGAARKFTPVSIAKYSSVKFADSALIFGNSASTSFTAQNALIANPKSRVSSVDFDLIKLNADINHGNSGGGLFNLKGDMIGIVTYRMEGKSSKPEDLIQGIGYALNTDDVKEVLQIAYPEVYGKIQFETYDDTVTETPVA